METHILELVFSNGGAWGLGVFMAWAFWKVGTRQIEMSEHRTDQLIAQAEKVAENHRSDIIRITSSFAESIKSVENGVNEIKEVTHSVERGVDEIKDSIKELGK